MLEMLEPWDVCQGKVRIWNGSSQRVEVKGLLLYLLFYISSLMEAKEGTQGLNLEAGTEAKIRKECIFLIAIYG